MDAQEIQAAVAHQDALTAAAEAPFVNRRDPARALGPDGQPARQPPRPHLGGRARREVERLALAAQPPRQRRSRRSSAILNLTDEEREGLSAPDKFRVDITPYFISLIDPDDPNDPIRRQVIPLGREHAGLHGDDGGLARRGPPLAGAGPGPSLPGPRPDAGHDPVRELLPLLHAVADRRRPDPELQPQATTRPSSTTCAARRRSATC